MGQQDRFNLIKMWISGVLRTISSSCLAILPVFFLRNGLTEVQISFYSSLAQTVNLVVSLSCSGITAYYKDSRKILAVLLFLQGLLSALYALFGLFSMNLDVLYICILGIASLLAVVSALFTIFDYKLPCEIMSMKSYSTHVAYSSLFCGIVGTGISLVLPVLYRKYSFFTVASACILIAGVTLALSAFVMMWLKPIGESSVALQNQRPRLNPVKDVLRLLSNRDFRLLFIPNILRGFGSGMLSIISLIAIRGFSMEDGDVPLITAAANVGVFLSSFLYIILVKRLGIPWTGLVGGILFCLICFSSFGNATTFLAFYTLAQVGLHLLGNAIPNMIYCSIEPGIISQFQTWRMILLSLGSAIGTPVYAALLDKVPVIVLFLISAVAIFLSVLGYYLLYRGKNVKT